MGTTDMIEPRHVASGDNLRIIPRERRREAAAGVDVILWAMEEERETAARTRRRLNEPAR